MQTETGFAGFVRVNTPALLRTAYLLTGNAVAAEELVQDTLVHLYSRWERVEAADVPLAYVRRSLANSFVTQKRRPSSREHAVAELPDRADGRDAFARVSDRDELWGLLSTLPERQRAALVLRYFHDQSDAEIAESLDCRLGTVRSLISRGLATLRGDIASPAGPRRLA